MKTSERTFESGSVIFHEGENGDSVFIVESGRIELTKAGPDGQPVQLAMIGANELLGEMGAVDDAPRGATARVLETARVRAIPRREFKAWLQQEPDAAMRVIAVLVERLRAADALIARSKGAVGAAGIEGQAQPAPGLIEAVITWIGRRRTRAGGGQAPGAETPPFKIGVAVLDNDTDRAWTQALAGLLEGKTGIAARALETPVQPPTDDNQAQMFAAVVRARQLLAQIGDLDLLIWGAVDENGFSLAFTGLAPSDDERPGNFGPYVRLSLAADMEAPVVEVLYAVALAAIEPSTDAQHMLLHRALPAALDAIGDLPKALPNPWGAALQRSALGCLGHAFATVAAWDGDKRWYERAAEAYRAAIQRLPRGDHGIDEALLRRHLGGVLMAMADKRQDAAMLEAAVTEFRTGLECLMKTTHPQEWGGAQNRLGLALQKLDLLSGRSDLIKDALAAFHAALTAFPRAEAPQRWAEVMNNLAQALQTYGDQVKSPEVLERAVEACKAALELRFRERQPLAWAATQNTLGSALFLLDKHRQSTEHLDQAAVAFAGALDVFRQFGAAKQAQVAMRNLAHVQKLIKLRAERKVAMPDWAED